MSKPRRKRRDECRVPGVEWEEIEEEDEEEDEDDVKRMGNFSRRKAWIWDWRWDWVAGLN